MSSERTPLLQNRHQVLDPYDRFTPQKKKVITLVISLAGIIARTFFLIFEVQSKPSTMVAFASGCFIPTIPQIAEELNTTGEIVK